MSDRNRSLSRNEQRQAREVMRADGLTYMQARRVNQRQHGQRQHGRRGSGPLAVAPAQATWIKSIHCRHDAWTITPGDETWISDIG